MLSPIQRTSSRPRVILNTRKTATIPWTSTFVHERLTALGQRIVGNSGPATGGDVQRAARTAIVRQSEHPDDVGDPDSFHRRVPAVAPVMSTGQPGKKLISICHVVMLNDPFFHVAASKAAAFARSQSDFTARQTV